MKSFEGSLSAERLRLAIVVAKWNAVFSEKLVDGALKAITLHGGDTDNLTIVKIPGSFEIPLACKELLMTKQYDAVIALGTLLEGETDHYRLIAEELSHGLMQLGLSFGVPVTFGVLTVKNMEQAVARSGENQENKGFEAASAAIEMANALQTIRESVTRDGRNNG